MSLHVGNNTTFRPLAGVVAGVIAGAAGATALNAVSYVMQAVQAAPASETPGQTVNALADATGVEVPGGPAEKENRIEALGPLAGIGVGVGVGALAGLLRAYSVKIPKPVAAVVTGLGAMLISDATMTALKITDPRSWGASTVVQDAVPHLVYGAVTTAAVHRMLDPQTPQLH